MFVQSLVVQRRIDGEHRVLRGRTFTVSDARGSVSIPLASGADFARCLVESFDLDLPDAGALWERAG